VVPLGDNAPAADKGLQEPPTTLPALLRTMVGADSLDAPKKGQRQSEPQPKNSAATLQHENNSEKHAIKTDKITIQGFTSDWGIPQFNDEAEQPLLRNTNSNEKLA